MLNASKYKRLVHDDPKKKKEDDKDKITYSINDKRFAQEDNVFTWQTNYDSAGAYEITVSASDGQDTAEQTFALTVENVNRPPVIIDIVQKK